MKDCTQKEVVIPKDVYDCILKIRDSGLTNMFDVDEVIRLAVKFKYQMVAEWLSVASNRSSYLYGIFNGFTYVYEK